MSGSFERNRRVMQDCKEVMEEASESVAELQEKFEEIREQMIEDARVDFDEKTLRLLENSHDVEGKQ